MIMKEVLRELVKELRTQNKLLALFYHHKAVGWDSNDDALKLCEAESNGALSIINFVEQNLQ